MRWFVIRFAREACSRSFAFYRKARCRKRFLIPLSFIISSRLHGFYHPRSKRLFDGGLRLRQHRLSDAYAEAAVLAICGPQLLEPLQCPFAGPIHAVASQAGLLCDRRARYFVKRKKFEREVSPGTHLVPECVEQDQQQGLLKGTFPNVVGLWIVALLLDMADFRVPAFGPNSFGRPSPKFSHFIANHRGQPIAKPAAASDRTERDVFARRLSTSRLARFLPTCVPSSRIAGRRRRPSARSRWKNSSQASASEPSCRRLSNFACVLLFAEELSEMISAKAGPFARIERPDFTINCTNIQLTKPDFGRPAHIYYGSWQHNAATGGERAPCVGCSVNRSRQRPMLHFFPAYRLGGCISWVGKRLQSSSLNVKKGANMNSINGTAVLFFCLVFIGFIGFCGIQGEAADEPPTELYVRTVPEGAKVFIEGKELGITPGLFKVEPGTAKILVKLEGQDPIEKEVEIKASRVTRIELELKKQRGSAASSKTDSAPQDQNILKNSGVEAGDATPDNWEQGAEIAGVKYTWDKEVAFAGKASLCIEKTAQTYFPIAQWSQTVDREGEKPALLVSAQVKAKNMTKGFIDVIFLDEHDNWIKHTWVTVIGNKQGGKSPANHDWKKYSGKVEIPPKTKKLCMALQVYGPGKVWFDDVRASYTGAVLVSKDGKETQSQETTTSESLSLHQGREDASASKADSEKINSDKPDSIKTDPESEAVKLLKKAQAEADASSPLDKALKDWSDALHASNQSVLAKNAAAEWNAANRKASLAKLQADAGKTETAASLYTDAIASLNKANEISLAKQNAKVKPVIQKLEAAVKRKDKAAAESLLAEIEKIIPNDERIIDLRNSVESLTGSRKNITLDLGNGANMEFILIQPGSFTMGGA